MTQLIGVTLPYYPIRKLDDRQGARSGPRPTSCSRPRCASSARPSPPSSSAPTIPVGQTIRIGRSPYRVIGLLGSRGSSSFGDDQDDRIMMPAGSYRARVMHMPPGRVDQLMFSAHERADGGARADSRSRRSCASATTSPTGGSDDFDIRTQAEMRETTDGILGDALAPRHRASRPSACSWAASA